MRAKAPVAAWGPVVVWLAFQLTLTSLPGSALPSFPAWRLDWVAHFCIYFGLGFLVARAGVMSGWPPRVLLFAWGAVAAFAALDELHQLLIPGRGTEAMDWLMDFAGSAAGLAMGTQLMRSKWGHWLR